MAPIPLPFDRTKQYRARLRGKTLEFEDYATREMLAFDPLPCWRHLPEGKYQEQVTDLVKKIEEEAAMQRRASGRSPLGRKTILRQHPHTRPMQHRKSPAPAFHAATKPARKLLAEAYRWFVKAYREAAERLRAGVTSTRFPEGCFPPALPFVEVARLG